jgi:prepilin-type N-terminal cleavage/methylation domain-containing protein/prepilin-type processing-associated H-X9-DG protein
MVNRAQHRSFVTSHLEILQSELRHACSAKRGTSAATPGSKTCAGDRVARRGFTLIELLVMVSIVGILAAMLLPAIQSAREAARRTDCMNNVKQLALAALNHHDAQGFYPTGGWGWFWVGDADRGYGKEQPGGWIYNLLPYCEQRPLHDLPSDGLPEERTRVQRVGAAAVIESPLSIINCPSRRAVAVFPLTANESGNLGFFNSITPNAAGRSDYAINAGDVYCEWPNHALGQGPSSYEDAKIWSANRTWGSEQTRYSRTPSGENALTGISYERSMISIRHVSDGISKTYLIAERYIPQSEYMTGLSDGDNETWCTGFNNDNYRKTARLVGSQIVELTPIPDTAQDVEDSMGRFGAAHPGGWNASFCDGSVRTISYDIDWRVHRDMGNRADGNIATKANL